MSLKHLTIWWVLLLALVLRLAALTIFLQFQPNPDAMGAAVRHVREAENILAGYGFSYVPGTPSTQFPPGYAFLLAGTSFVLGKGYLGIWLLHILLGVATVWLTYLLARTRLSKEHSLLAGLLVAVYPSFIVDPITLIKEIPYTPLLILAAYWTVKGISSGSARHFLLGGISAGIATYFRAELAGLVVLGTLMLALLRQTRWTNAGLLIGAFAIVVLPWVLRNSLITRHPVFISTLGGYNLYVGNNFTTPFLQSWRGESAEAIGQLHLIAGENEYAQDAAGTQMAVSYIVSHPLSFLARGLGKMMDLWGPDRLFFSWYRAGLFARSVPMLLAVGIAVASAMGYVILFFLAATGVLFFKTKTLTLLLVGLVAYTTALAIVLFGAPRFHWPLVPFLAILAAQVVMERRVLFHQILASRRKVAIAVLIAFAVITIQLVEVIASGDLARVGVIG